VQAALGLLVFGAAFGHLQACWWWPGRSGSPRRQSCCGSWPPGLAAMKSRDMTRYAAMRPCFEVVAQAVPGLVDGSDFFDMHAKRG